MKRSILVLTLMLVLGAGHAAAVTPDEVLPDAAMEARARDIAVPTG